jgi:ATP-dependent DNA ligase
MLEATKNGHDHSSRVRWMTDALARLPGVRSFVIDGELVACDGDGVPHFYRLHFHSRKYGRAARAGAINIVDLKLSLS